MQHEVELEVLKLQAVLKDNRFHSASFGTVAWAESLAALLSGLSLFQQTVWPHALQQAAQSVYDTFFNANTPGVRMQRFPTLHAHIKMELLPQCIKDSLKAAEPAFNSISLETAALCCRAENMEEHHTAALAKSYGCLLMHVLLSLKRLPLSLPDDYQLVEDASVQALRTTIEEKLSAMKAAQDNICNIQTALNINCMDCAPAIAPITERVSYLSSLGIANSQLA